LDRTANWSSEKNMAESMRCQKEENEYRRAKTERKKEVKTGNDFLATENWKFDSNNFLFKNSLKHMQVGFCFVHLIA
jgi:hypothetical protein